MPRHHLPPNRLRRGATAVEMALVLPLLLMLAFAGLDYGRAIRGQIALTNAARVGAEYGATHRFIDDTRAAWEAAIRAAVAEEAATIPGYQPADMTVTIQATPDASGAWRVIVAADMTFRTIIRWPGVPPTIALHHQVGVRQYR